MMVDVNGSLQTFFDGCNKAGPDICPFYAPSSSDIADKLDALTSSIKEQPIPVVTPDSHGVVDFGFLRNVIFQSLFAPYDPAVGFVPLAQALAALANGNATALYELIPVPSFECPTSPPGPFHLNNFESYTTIACGDPVPVNDTVAQLEEYWLNAAKVSQFADLVGSSRVLCACVSVNLLQQTIAEDVFPEAIKYIVKAGSRVSAGVILVARVSHILLERPCWRQEHKRSSLACRQHVGSRNCPCWVSKLRSSGATAG
jgi:hypothetical protein